MKTFSFKRGEVYLVNYPLPDVLGQTIPKYMINLQEGSIIDYGSTMVGVIITTFKNPTSFKLYPTEVLLTAQETKTQYGAKALCNQIHTISKQRIIELKYKLPLETMQRIDKKLLLGIGMIKIEDFQS